MIGKKGKGGDSNRYKDAMQEIKEQIEKNKRIGVDYKLDLDKYDHAVSEIKAVLSGALTTGDSGEEINVNAERDKLLKKCSEFVKMFQKMEDLQNDYQKYIDALKAEADKPEAELSKIKVRVKKQQRQLQELSLQEEMKHIPSILKNAEILLQNMEAKRDMPESGQNVEELFTQLIANTRVWIEEDEKILYGLRKAVHASKETMDFMEFRFTDLDREMSKGRNSGEGEWGQIRKEKQLCERYIKEQSLIAKRSADKLFEVRCFLDEAEKQIQDPRQDNTPIEELKEAIDIMKNHTQELQKKAEEFENIKKGWLDDLLQMEEMLEEMWRNL